jgi:hypothetical protein
MNEKRGYSRLDFVIKNLNMPMSKRSQVSIFIIIGILIIGIIGSFLIFRNKIENPYKNAGEFSSEISQINNIVEGCSRQRAIDAIRIVGLQGGYINIPNDYLKTNFSNIAYGYYLGKNTLPLKSTIEKEISSYIEMTLPYCIEKTDFPDISIDIGDASAKTEINADSVLISAKLPIYANKENKTFTINKNYNSEVKVRLNNILEVSNEIINKEIEDPNNIQLSYLTELDYYVMVLPENEKEIVYIISDNKSRIDDIPYSFLFANKLEI